MDTSDLIDEMWALSGPANPQSFRAGNNGSTATPAHAPIPSATVSSAPPRNGPDYSMSDDAIIAFLAEMPSAADNPARVAIWTELVRFKTRSLELQIAEAKRKEKEAELELARFKEMTAGGPNRTGAAPPVPAANTFGTFSQLNHLATAGPQIYPYLNNSQTAPNLPLQNIQQQNDPFDIALPQAQPTNDQNSLFPDTMFPQSMTPFDLHAITENFDDMFNWLPDFDQNGNLLVSGDQGIAPSALQLPSSRTHSDNDLSLTIRRDSDVSKLDPPTPIKRRASSADTVEDEQPTAKKSRRATGKRITVEVASACQVCRKAIARVIIRAPQAEMPDPITPVLKCLVCQPVQLPAQAGDIGLGSSSIGTVETRKRQRIGVEAEDEEGKVKERRQYCDVCQRIIGSGQIKSGKENIGYLAELVCTLCDSKYQRCTDCGGGGGPRQGIGKWRLKQVFHAGRKTCSLSHNRLGDRTREIGVHVTPSDFTPEQFKEVITRCKALWQEKNLARLAVPEMLEIDLPPNIVNPLQTYADIENQITGNWPSREAMIRAEGADPERFKRILALTWAHAKPRRGVRTVDLEEEYHKGEDDDEDNSTVLDNIKKTNVVIPAGCDLIGMWGGEWDMHHGSILVSTFIPFEGTDGEDSTALSVGEIITKVQTLQHSMNAEKQKVAKKNGVKVELNPQVEHLWVVSGGSVPLVRERMADILIRKRSFVHVEEYLTRHPSFADALHARPYGLHPTDGASPNADGSPPSKPLILVRWLGKDFDAQKILEIKQMEFGGKSKPKKKVKGKA